MDIVQEIERLEEKALRAGMIVDWETASLIPNPLTQMSHHQRAAWASIEDNARRKRDHYDNQDNNPASPEQAGW